MLNARLEHAGIISITTAHSRGVCNSPRMYVSNHSNRACLRTLQIALNSNWTPITMLFPGRTVEDIKRGLKLPQTDKMRESLSSSGPEVSKEFIRMFIARNRKKGDKKRKTRS